MSAFFIALAVIRGAVVFSLILVGAAIYWMVLQDEKSLEQPWDYSEIQMVEQEESGTEHPVPNPCVRACA